MLATLLHLKLKHWRDDWTSWQGFTVEWLLWDDNTFCCTFSRPNLLSGHPHGPREKSSNSLPIQDSRRERMKNKPPFQSSWSWQGEVWGFYCSVCRLFLVSLFSVLCFSSARSWKSWLNFFNMESFLLSEVKETVT